MVQEDADGGSEQLKTTERMKRRTELTERESTLKMTGNGIRKLESERDDASVENGRDLDGSVGVDVTSDDVDSDRERCE